MLRGTALLLVVASTASCGPNGDLGVGDFTVTADGCLLAPEQLLEEWRAAFPDGAVPDQSVFWIYAFSLRDAIPVHSEFHVSFEYETTTTVIESPMQDRLQWLSGGSGWADFRALREGPAVVMAYDRRDHRLIDYTHVTVRDDCSMDGGAPGVRDAGADAP